jgi:hypothetical protein
MLAILSGEGTRTGSQLAAPILQQGWTAAVALQRTTRWPSTEVPFQLFVSDDTAKVPSIVDNFCPHMLKLLVGETPPAAMPNAMCDGVAGIERCRVTGEIRGAS